MCFSRISIVSVALSLGLSRRNRRDYILAAVSGSHDPDVTSGGVRTFLPTRGGAVICLTQTFNKIA